MKLTIETKINMDEALLRNLFKVIKNNNYCEKKSVEFQEAIIRAIEYFIIRYYDMEYASDENGLRPVVDTELRDYRINSKEYKYVSSQIYDSIKRKLLEFCDIQKNKDKYRDSSYSDKAKRALILNSLEIVGSEVWKIKDMPFYKKIEKIKQKIKKEKVLLVYIKLLKDSKTNFVAEGHNRKYFYPIIVDMYLDYAAIMENLLVNEREIKKRKKRYPDYIEKVKKGEHVINDIYYYLMKFSKEERVENIKKFVLQFYLDSFDNNRNINTLFKKLYLDPDEFDNKKSFDPANMKKYKKKVHNIFVMGANISKFI